ncbi:MAG TPA: GTP-binding protein [Bryobacteraceae bacterium]|jgi:hypothetical protein|nr:GTP-binding protein [Bryobacteraceae bacterium]
MNTRPVLVVVGGFLGAGKTTLILSAASLLAKRGKRSAVILNDQGGDLVDTRFVRQSGFAAGEVTGGCFCCRFSDLISAASELRAHSPDVIFAEPVGSCTDISATILQPLRRDFPADYRLAAYTVLVDPAQANALRRAGANPDMRFLYEKQLEEADLVCLTKADLGETAECGATPSVSVSAKTGEGVEAWLDRVIAGDIPAGGQILEIDYQRYAEAEAALAWLNCAATVRPSPPLSPAQVLGPLVDALQARLNAAGIPIAHLKAVDDSPAGFLKAAVTGNSREPVIEGAFSASPSETHELFINLRAVGEPDLVRKLVEDEVRALPGEISVDRLVCFRPSPPKPERRIPAVV